MVSVKAAQLAAALLTLSACGIDEPPVVATSRYVEFATDEDFELCDVNLRRFDRYIERVYEDMGTEPPSGLLLRYNYVPGAMPKECKGLLGCAMPAHRRTRDFGTVFSTAPNYWHEVAHTIAYDAVCDEPEHGTLGEGFAELYASPDPEWSGVNHLMGGFDVESYRELGELHFDVAAFFALAIIARHGIGAYLDFVASACGKSTAGGDAVHQSMFGETVQETVDADPFFQGCLKPFARCTEPAVPWASDSLTLPASPTCETEGLAYSGFASWSNGDVSERRYVISLDRGSYVTVSAPQWADVRLETCDMECGDAWWSVRDGETHELMIPPGDYELVIVARIEDADRGGDIELSRRDWN